MWNVEQVPTLKTKHTLIIGRVPCARRRAHSVFRYWNQIYLVEKSPNIDGGELILHKVAIIFVALREHFNVLVLTKKLIK
jgi:siroheme synthase (precorrin-2 oxidase/ferrochelatase)